VRKHTPARIVRFVAHGHPQYSQAELYTAKQFLKSKAGKDALATAPRLTADQAAAIWLYTCESPLCRELNRLLRSRDRKALLAGFFPYLRLLLEAFSALSEADGRPRMVNRGVPLDLISAHADVYEEGRVITWWSFSSCTTKLSVLENPAFLGKAGDRTIFQILTRRGVNIGPFSAIRSEAEVPTTHPIHIAAPWPQLSGLSPSAASVSQVLLPAGIALEITGVLSKDSSGLTIISCQDDPDAPPLIS
jgi:hypothetical protein